MNIKKNQFYCQCLGFHSLQYMVYIFKNKKNGSAFYRLSNRAESWWAVSYEPQLQ